MASIDMLGCWAGDCLESRSVWGGRGGLLSITRLKGSRRGASQQSTPGVAVCFAWSRLPESRRGAAFKVTTKVGSGSESLEVMAY